MNTGYSIGRRRIRLSSSKLLRQPQPSFTLREIRYARRGISQIYLSTNDNNNNNNNNNTGAVPFNLRRGDRTTVSSYACGPITGIGIQQQRQLCSLHGSRLINHRIANSFPPSQNVHSSVGIQQQQREHRQGESRRYISSWLPEVVQNFSIWGGTGVVLKSMHADIGLPYWGCFSVMNFCLRASLLPIVVYSAKMAARYAKVAPEVQFIMTLFQNDLKKMRAQNKSLYEQRYLFLQNLQTLRAIYKLHNINPLMVFLSPLLQIPFFYYVAVDLRKIVNGADPELAQELTESNFLWVHDLTDPDPWYGLPIASGLMLYANVEVAIGKQSLSGPTAAQSDFARLLKDLFQTLAVFMPCFASQSPAGLQIYLVSSFTWTLFQSAALRDDTVRGWIGLPAMGTPPTEPKYAQEFMEFKRLEQKAKEIRGDGPVLGRNVLAVGFETSFPGTHRPSTIVGSGGGTVTPASDINNDDILASPSSSSSAVPKVRRLTTEEVSAAWGGHFIHGISAPMAELEARWMEQMKEEQMRMVATDKLRTEQEKYMEMPSERDMEAANLGVKYVPVGTATSSSASSTSDTGLNVNRFKKTTNRPKNEPSKKHGGRRKRW